MANIFEDAYNYMAFPARQRQATGLPTVYNAARPAFGQPAGLPASDFRTATPVNVPGTPNGSLLAGKNTSQLQRGWPWQGGGTAVASNVVRPGTPGGLPGAPAAGGWGDDPIVNEAAWDNGGPTQVAQAGANPGDDGLFGFKQTYFPPEQVPPAGIDPTVWAASSSAPPGGATPQMSPAQLYAFANANPTMGPNTGNATNGYAYRNGQQIGKVPWAAAVSPSQQYAIANANPTMGPNTGVAGGYQYVNGQKVGKDPAYAGMSPSDTYAAINANAAANPKYAPSAWEMKGNQGSGVAKSIASFSSSAPGHAGAKYGSINNGPSVGGRTPMPPRSTPLPAWRR